MTTFKLEQYTSFESLEELNHHVSLHVKNNQLTNTQYRLLTILSQYSVKYLGASYLKLNTLAGILDVSKRTVQRNMKALVEKGIITKKFNFRPVSGGYGASIYIINQYKETTNVISEVSSCDNSETTAGERLLDEIEQKETTSLKAKYNNSLVLQSSDKQREYNLDYKDVCPSNIPLQLGNHMLKFFDSATVYRLYNSMNKALGVYEGREDYDAERLTEIKYRGFNALVSAIKKARNGLAAPVENKFGYVYSATMSIAVADEFSFM